MMEYDMQASRKVLKKFTWKELRKLCDSHDSFVTKESFIPRELIKRKNKDDKVQVVMFQLKEEILMAYLVLEKMPLYSFFLASEIGMEEGLKEQIATADRNYGLRTGHYRTRN